ncbi:MAG: NAD-dependent epimerase/dehydratase family protein [candidate division Zixibacteria bacterium]|nr:NAD-dependent epimerase/dehydratase family protein [candidate division Zixibacteria bacterium]
MDQNLKALVTGANGFVGSHLVEGLLDKGYQVRCLVRKTSNLRWLSGLEVEFAHGDITEKSSLKSVVKDVDLVFHIAGLTKAKTREEYFRANAEGTKNLVEACLEENPQVQRFVYISSQAAVGPGDDKQPLNETAPCRPITHYGESKLEGERIVLKHASQLPVTVIRPPAVYGPRDSDMLGFFKVANKGFRISFGRGESFLSLVYVKDLVDGIILAAEKSKSIGEVYFIADDKIYSWREAFKIIARVLNKRTIPLKIPKSLVLFLAFISENFSKLLGKTAVFNTQKAKEITQRYWGLDVSKAKAELGFLPKYDLKRGAKETVRWYKEKEWL